MRISKEAYYLKIAEVVASRSTCLKHKYGAVLVKDDVIISTGYNGAPRGEVNCCDSGCCRASSGLGPVNSSARVHGNQYGSCVAVHAEQNAILNAGRSKCVGATLYLACLTPGRSAIPCNICNRLINNVSIKKIVVKGIGRGGNTKCLQCD